jgi:ribosomal protein L12E/L44/L45/RPP1/RPP2
MKRTTQRNFKLNNEDIETVRDQKAEKGHMIAAAINAAIVAHDADKRADAEAPKEEKKEEAKADESGEMLNKILCGTRFAW